MSQFTTLSKRSPGLADVSAARAFSDFTVTPISLPRTRRRFDWSNVAVNRLATACRARLSSLLRVFIDPRVKREKLARRAGACSVGDVPETRICYCLPAVKRSVAESQRFQRQRQWKSKV